MTLQIIPRQEEDLKVDIIQVPIGMTVEEAWGLICQDIILIHPKGDPGWVAILTDEDDNLIEVLK